MRIRLSVMPTTLKFTSETTSGELTIKIQSNLDVAMDADSMEELKRAILAFHGHSPIYSCRFHQQGANPLNYNFEFAALDGRTWNQTFVFDTPLDPKETIDGVTEWRTSELVYFRDLRRAISQAHALHDVYDVKIDFVVA